MFTKTRQIKRRMLMVFRVCSSNMDLHILMMIMYDDFFIHASLKIVVFLHSTVLAGLKLILCIFICHISIGCFSVSLLLFCTLKNNNFSFLCVWFASICNLFSIQTFVCLKCLFAAYFVFFYLFLLIWCLVYSWWSVYPKGYWMVRTA